MINLHGADSTLQYPKNISHRRSHRLVWAFGKLAYWKKITCPVPINAKEILVGIQQ